MSGMGSLTGGDDGLGQGRKRGRKRMKVSEETGIKPEKPLPRQQTEKEKNILQYITDQAPTEEELDRIMKVIRDRLGRASTKADHKRLQNLEPEISASLKDIRGELKGIKEENKIVEAKFETLQKEKMNLSDALLNVTMENKMYQLMLKATTGMSPQDLGIGIQGNVPHGGSLSQYPMNMGFLSQYAMNMGNQQQAGIGIQGFGMGQTQITGVCGAPSASGMMQRQCQMPGGSDLSEPNTLFGAAGSAPVMIQGSEELGGVPGPRKMLEDHKPSEDKSDWFFINELLPACADLQEPLMNEALNNHPFSSFGASTSSTATHGNMGNAFQGC